MSQPKETESLNGGGGAPPPPPLPPTSPPAQPDYQSQPASVPSEYGSIETPYVSPDYSWYEDIRRNKPQSTSLSAASLIFISGGMSLASSVGVGFITEYGTHYQYCWFIAVIIGACISALLAHKVTKCAFNLSASILVIIEGIIYIALNSNPTWIVFARYCDGIAFGLVIIPAILAGSEQSVKRFRGGVLSAEQSGLTTGAMLLSLFATGWTDESERNLVHGIACTIYGFIALMFTFVFTIESPMFHLQKNNETEAINVLRQLQKPRTVTNETYALLNENKALLEEDLTRGRVENISNSWKPMVKITVLRTLVSLSLSLPLTWGFIVASTPNNDKGTVPNFFVYILMRLIGVTCSVLTIDSLGRRKTSAIALLIGSIFLLGIGTLFSSSSETSQGTLYITLAFLFIHQILAGLVAPASTCYLGEAFSPSVKPYFILISIIVENIIQIIIVGTQASIDSTSNFAYVLGAIQFIYAFVFFFTMPETKQTTLREALDKFKKTVYINLGNV